jgi:hypothetical protein
MFAAAMRLAIVRAGGSGSAAALFALDQQGCVAEEAQQLDSAAKIFAFFFFLLAI